MYSSVQSANTFPRGYSATSILTSPPSLMAARNIRRGVAPACVDPPEDSRSSTYLRSAPAFLHGYVRTDSEGSSTCE
jgi:hypothetical protein